MKKRIAAVWGWFKKNRSGNKVCYPSQFHALSINQLTDQLSRDSFWQGSPEEVAHRMNNAFFDHAEMLDSDEIFWDAAREHISIRFVDPRLSDEFLRRVNEAYLKLTA